MKWANDFLPNVATVKIKCSYAPLWEVRSSCKSDGSVDWQSQFRQGREENLEFGNVYYEV